VPRVLDQPERHERVAGAQSDRVAREVDARQLPDHDPVPQGEDGLAEVVALALAPEPGRLLAVARAERRGAQPERRIAHRSPSA
jgi:hypothetical protein